MEPGDDRRRRDARSGERAGEIRRGERGEERQSDGGAASSSTEEAHSFFSGFGSE